MKQTNVSIPYRQTKNRETIIEALENGYKFQFLIGRLKTVFRLGYYPRGSRVSIPYRQTKNEDTYFQQIEICFLVSIPYRQTKNVGRLVRCTIRFPQFQFLIGRLKTNLRAICRLEGNKFQFLIGRLKTMCSLLTKAHLLLSFNSLQVD